MRRWIVAALLSTVAALAVEKVRRHNPTATRQLELAERRLSPWSPGPTAHRVSKAATTDSQHPHCFSVYRRLT